MEGFFERLVSKLTHEDLVILNTLYSNDSYNSYSAIPKSVILEDTKLTEAIYRKTITSLEKIALIEVSIGAKQHSYYLTKFGIQALDKIIEGMDTEC